MESAEIRWRDLKTNQVVHALQGVFNPYEFAWLPGSDLVAYVAQISQTDGRTQITIAHPDGSVLQHIPKNAIDFSNIRGLTISPDAQWFGFEADILSAAGPQTADIYVTNLDGSQTNQLTSERGQDLVPAWSPLDDWIAFASDRDGDYDIYLVKPDGTGLINVTHDSDSSDFWPAWRLLGAQ